MAILLDEHGNFNDGLDDAALAAMDDVSRAHVLNRRELARLAAESARDQREGALARLSPVEFANLRDTLTDEQRVVADQVDRYLRARTAFYDELRAFEKQQQVLRQFPDRPLGEARLEQPVPPEPPRLFVSGPGGTGKSFLINYLAELCRRHTAQLHRAGSTNGMLLCAPTGVAAANISGKTAHNALKLPVNRKGDCSNSNKVDAGGKLTPLSAEFAHSLSAEFRDLEMLVIDEVCRFFFILFFLMILKKNHP